MLRRICSWIIKFLPWFGINSLGLLLFVVVDNGMLILIVVPWKENTEIFRYRPFFLSHNFLKLQLNCFSYWIWVQNTYAGINSRDLHNTDFSFIFYGIYLMMWGRESSIVSIGSTSINWAHYIECALFAS